MGEISFSGKAAVKKKAKNSIETLPKTFVPIIPPNRDWYKKYCHKCPYLVREEGLDRNNEDGEKDKVAVRCVRPVDEKCIVTDSVLVSQLVMREMLVTTQKLLAKKEESKSAEFIVAGAATLKRRRKIHKRRR